MMKPYWWNKEDDEVLKELWHNSDVTKEDLMMVFPTRSWGAIEHRARKLNLGTRTRPSDINYEYLKKLREVVEI